MAQAMSAAGGGVVGQKLGGGDTTLTKVFVGGLAWETHGEGVQGYFEQFGQILEAVVIADRRTGRSKGYGFVTFRETEAAMRACLNPYPVIDGRRANCNLAYLGVHRSNKAAPPPSLQLQPYIADHVHGMRAAVQAAVSGGGGGAMSFPDHGIQQGIPAAAAAAAAAYNVYGYSPYFSNYSYQQPLAYYQAYGGLQAAAGGGAPQYQVFNGGVAAPGLAMPHDPSGGPLYPYLQYGPESATAAGYSMMMQYYPQMYQYMTAAVGAPASPTTATGLPQYGGAVALSHNFAGQAPGMAISTLTAPTLPAPMAPVQYQYRLISSHLPEAAAVPDQNKSSA